MPSTTTRSGDNIASSDPATPAKASPASKDSNGTNATSSTATPACAKRISGETPKPAPAAAGGTHQRSSSRKPEPSLLTDFLLGRPSPARLEAERRRRQSIEVVKAELRQEMRQSLVRKVQPPGGMGERVKVWQRANAAAMAVSSPENAASEPTEVAFQGEDLDSVTEEDRVRIKLRQKRRNTTKFKPIVNNNSETGTADVKEPSKPPKKRIVSDDHWVKPRVKKTGARKVSPRPRKTTNPTRIPSGFVFRATPNPSASSKVKAWAEKVVVPGSSPPRGRWSSRMTAKYSVSDDTQSSGNEDAPTEVTARRPLKPTLDTSDSIRVRPIRKKKLDGDGIRVCPMPSSPTLQNDDGIRVRPVSDLGSEPSTPRPTSFPARKRGTTTPVTSPGNGTIHDLIRAVEEATQLSMKEDTEELDPLLDTATKDPRHKPRSGMMRRPTMHSSSRVKSADNESRLGDNNSNLSSTYMPESDLFTSVTSKTLADIPGDIPVGHSAFSELDLPLRGAPRSRPKRPNVDRTASLKNMPNVIKKVVEEGKKIIQDMSESPRHAVPNNPPSIEKWLNNTVEPTADSSKKESPTPTESEDEPGEEQPNNKNTLRRKPLQETQSSEVSGTNITSSVVTAPTDDITQYTIDSAKSSPKSTPAAKDALKNVITPPSTALRRSRATRSSSTPSKSSAPSKHGGGRQLLGVLKEAFRGESAELPKPIKSYQSREERIFESDDELASSHLQSSSDLSNQVTTDTHSSTDRDLSVRMAEPSPQMAGPRLRPPTNGQYELSTILSEEDSSAIGSDMTSDVTRSTLTQSTAFTKSSASSKPLQYHGSGLRRRLTRHSDLVSVLSLPDDTNIPQAIRNNRSRPSLRKTRGASNDVTSDELLKEFADDENLYQRELKTLVDGVVPVLLTHVVNDMTASELFGPATARHRVDAASKSVVDMGVSLQRLKDAHNKAPLTDIRRLAHWAHGVVPIYHNYFSAWRMGFQDLIVNLAPRGNVLDDEDSLLDALPRNASGDIINAEGERVAVAYLLKRPLIRVKQMTKLIQCLDLIIGSSDTNDLVKDFGALQETARRRHKEEVARMTDEEAINTDKTRARELRTLRAAKFINIDPSRQVNAKDVFSLDLAHSNGQRLECQVELVHRDSQNCPDDQGDLLIREVGAGHRSYLLFPPVSMSLVSARAGRGIFDMVVMIRGTHDSRPWYELLTLYADDDEQILDWLNILPESPLPAWEPEPSVLGESDVEPASPSRQADVPVGAQSMVGGSSRSQTPEPESRHSTPPSPLRSPPQLLASARDKTPTSEDYKSEEDRSRPLREDMRPDPTSLKRTSALYQNDVAPPRPPVHRTLSPSPQKIAKSQPTLKPPLDLALRRRGSSPLKHEYLPSDVSSTSELSTISSMVEEEEEEDTEIEKETEDEVSDLESSDEEIEDLDIPQTELGFSIKNEGGPRDSMILASECSLTPSNSASQAGLHGHKTTPGENAGRYLASISRWSDKGVWNDISPEHCSVTVTDGLIEAYALGNDNYSRPDYETENRPLLALDLTPLVLIRQSTAVDLEIRSSVKSYCKIASAYGGGNFRFRCFKDPDCYNLYMAVHHARLNNQKFIQLENEARFKSFGERQAPAENDGDSSSRRRSWFGRKNSYRSSVRAPSQSHDCASTAASSTPSASSFLKKLTLVGNLSFNLARSSIDKHGQPASGGNSLYTSGSSSGYRTPRSPSVSIEDSGQAPTAMGTDNIRIRLHLLVSASKWEDYGNCGLQIRRPPPGWRQALRADHGLEKRITVTTTPKKSSEKPLVVLDAVLGSGCFSPMGSRGIVCGVWEEVKNSDGVVGVVPATGATGGNIKKWCFQLSSVAEASWVLRLVHQEVVTM